MIFKCVNTDVADLTTGEIYDRSLLPVYSWECEDILGFLSRRVYSNYNKIARRIELHHIERTAFKLSLSDSYWISFNPDERFEDASPYYQEFGTLDFVRGLTEPTLRLQGTFDKEWVRFGSKTFIRKREPIGTANLEVIASAFAAVLGVGHSPAAILTDRDGSDGLVCIPNMSSPKTMFLDFGSVLPANALSKDFDGIIQKNVQSMYDKIGLRNIGEYILRVNLFDSIVGNEDRRENQGNWGFFKSTADGAVALSPAYDFNLAYALDMHKEILDQRISGIKKAKKGILAKSYLDKWHNQVRAFCLKFEYGSWYNNFLYLREKLK